MKKYIITLKIENREETETDIVAIIKAKNEEQLIQKISSCIGYDEGEYYIGFKYMPLKKFLKLHYMNNSQWYEFIWKKAEEK